MAASSVAAFWAVAVLLIIVPGPDWAFTIGAGLRGGLCGRRGRRPGHRLRGHQQRGRGRGRYPGRPDPGRAHRAHRGRWPLPDVARVADVRPGRPRRAHPGAGAAAGAPGGSNRALLVRGIGVSGLNPKGLLVLLALLPQFASPRGSWPLSAQLGLLGLVFTLSCAVFYLGLGSSARKVLHTRPRAAAAISRLSGAAMFVIGALLLAERLLA